jgi:hypothetical protein
MHLFAGGQTEIMYSKTVAFMVVSFFTVALFFGSYSHADVFAKKHDSSSPSSSSSSNGSGGGGGSRSGSSGSGGSSGGNSGRGGGGNGGSSSGNTAQPSSPSSTSKTTCPDASHLGDRGKCIPRAIA